MCYYVICESSEAERVLCVRKRDLAGCMTPPGLLNVRCNYTHGHVPLLSASPLYSFMTIFMLF